jgi:hypothetical protein
VIPSSPKEWCDASQQVGESDRRPPRSDEWREDLSGIARDQVAGVSVDALSTASVDPSLTSCRRCDAGCPSTVSVVFDGRELRAVCNVVSQEAIDEVRGLSDVDALGATVDELIEGIMAQHDMETPVLGFDGRYVTEEGSGSSIELHVPFTGTHGLFENQPNFYTSRWPDGSVSGQEIVTPLGAADAGANARAEELRRLTDQYLTAVRHDLEIWRNQLRDQLRSWITRRRQDAESHQAGLAQLGIPIRRRVDAPRTFTAPAIIRRETPARAAAQTTAVADTEPALSDAYYDHILYVIQAAGNAMERAPGTYDGWGEEDRRQVLILMLNTHYAGKVMAEAFNGDGKTDILIREGDKNVFIGECKFYEGPETVNETLKQVFGYVTWRDVKLAMIFFVDRVSFTQAIARIHETVAASPQFRAWTPMPGEQESEFRARMAWPGDKQRLVTMHVSAFHTPRSVKD